MLGRDPAYITSTPLRWIITTSSPGMTAKDAQTAPPGSADGTVFIDGLNEIVATRRFVSALATNQRA